MDAQPPPPSDRQAPPPPGRLLLSSLADFWSLIEPLLLAARPRAICEICIGDGMFTTTVLDFCRKNSCRYSGIDPAVDEKRGTANAGVEVRFFKSPSLSVLPELDAHDVYFVDGDHN